MRPRADGADLSRLRVRRHPGRACPQCHTALPIDFVDSESPMIGLVGAKGSGKTVLMTVLVKQLREVVGLRSGQPTDRDRQPRRR